MTARTPHDLANVRPTAELDHPLAGRPASGRPRRGPGVRRRKSARGPRQGWSVWAKLATGLSVVVIIAAAGMTALVTIVSPSTLVQDELVRLVKAETGRDLSVNGGASFMFYPNIAVALGNVALSGPEPGNSMITAERIEVSVALLPLINKRVRIERIALLRPVVNLHVDAAGRPNWDFARASRQSVRVRVAQLGAGLVGAGFGDLRHGFRQSQGQRPAGSIHLASMPAAGALLQKLELRAVTLEKARVFYQDNRTGAAEQLDDLDLQLSGKRITDPLSVRGDALWRNERFSFAARVSTVAELMQGETAKVRFTLSGSSLSAGFDGSIKTKGHVVTHGQTRLEGPSLERAASWLGMRLPNAGPLGGFMLSGQLAGSPRTVALESASLTLGQSKAVGALKVAFEATRPSVTADLKITQLDVDQLSAGLAGGTGSLLPAVVVTPGTSGRRPSSIEDLIRRSSPGAGGTTKGGVGRFAPQVRGYTNRNGWSSTPINIDQLRSFDAKARLRVDGLKVAGLSVSHATVRLVLANGEARADIDDLQLYEGKGQAVITARPTASGLGVGANVQVNQIEAGQLLGDSSGFDRLEGKGTLTASINGAGSTQQEIADSINGTAAIDFKNGAIVGWDLAKILQGLEAGRLPDLDGVPSERTAYSELAASFKITGGNAVTDDLRLISPLLRVKGNGDVRIGARSLDIAMQPRLLSSWQPAGQVPRVSGSGGGTPTGGGAQQADPGTDGSAGALEVPVKLKGPWHDPRIVLDTGELARDPQRLINQAKEFGRRFKGKNLGDIVRGVLGDDEDGNAKKPKDILKKLFGQ